MISQMQMSQAALAAENFPLVIRKSCFLFLRWCTSLYVGAILA